MKSLLIAALTAQVGFFAGYSYEQPQVDRTLSASSVPGIPMIWGSEGDFVIVATGGGGAVVMIRDGSGYSAGAATRRFQISDEMRKGIASMSGTLISQK